MIVLGKHGSDLGKDAALNSVTEEDMYMATVRAKFKLNSYTTELHGEQEKRTLNFTPVYSDEPGSENKIFWEYTPSGSLQLGTVNQEAWEQFEIGKEYYLDFTPAG